MPRFKLELAALAIVVAAVAAAVAGLFASAGAAPPRAARLWIGGDVHVDRASAAGALAALPPLVGGAPGIVNLEGPIAAHAASGGGVRLVNPPDAAVAALRRGGVRAVGIANNHAADAGPDGAAATARALRAAGLVPVGGPAGFGVLVVDGLRVAVTAHAIGGDGGAGAVPEGLAQDLQRARRAGDALVATFHFTGAASYLPAPALKRAVEIALGAGAAVVAVHGSHMVGPVERRGRAVVAWGLGNVAFACDCTRESEAILLEVDVGRDGAGRAAAVPIRAGLGGAAAGASGDAVGIFELLRAIGSGAMKVAGDRAVF